MYLELLPTFTWYGTSISPTVIVPNAPTYRLYLTMKYINSPLNELSYFISRSPVNFRKHVSNGFYSTSVAIFTFLYQPGKSIGLISQSNSLTNA